MACVVIIYPREKRPPLEINSFRSRMPRYGVLSVASYLKKYGHEVRVFCELSGSRIDWDAVRSADYVCFSFLSFCAAKAYAMADSVRAECGKPVIMGGAHCSVMPEDALEHADFVVRNEGEETLRELIHVLESGGEISSVAGISFKDSNGRPVHNEDRPFLEDISFPLDMELLPEYRSKGLLWSLRDAVANGSPRVAMPVVQASRGCAENCRFCIVKHQLGNKCRKRNLDVVLSEFEIYTKRFKSPYFFFTDNDLSADPGFSCELFSRILDRFGPGLRPYVYCRAGVFRNHDLLSLLEKFERTTIGIGFESLRDSSLCEFGKNQSSLDIRSAAEALRRYKLNIHGLFIFGGEEDTVRDIENTVDFCIEQEFFNIALTPLYDFPTKQAVLGQQQIIPDHLFIHRDWRFYSGNFAVHFPRLMRPSELQSALINGYGEFYRRSKHSMVPFMPTRPTMIRYADYLRRIEKPYYDAKGTRVDDMLEGRGAGDMASLVPVHVPQMSLYTETAGFLLKNICRADSWRILIGALFHGPRRALSPRKRVL